MSLRRVLIYVAIAVLFSAIVVVSYVSTKQAADRALERTVEENRQRVAANERVVESLRAETSRAIAAECAAQNKVYDVLRGLIFYATEPPAGATPEQAARAANTRAAFGALIPTLDCPTFTPGPSKPLPRSETTTTTGGGTAPTTGTGTGGGNAPGVTPPTPTSAAASGNPSPPTTRPPAPTPTLLPPLTIPPILPRVLNPVLQLAVEPRRGGPGPLAGEVADLVHLPARGDPEVPGDLVPREALVAGLVDRDEEQPPGPVRDPVPGSEVGVPAEAS